MYAADASAAAALLSENAPTTLIPNATLDGTLLALAWLVHEISISHAPY
ncbi:hypothetical protein [Comamonas sediminis]|uniref:Uncharacterized protein n=1 Tax=Comamonas sediminis TaxID=1783360 RepID=A0ABV4AXP7_9BURK